LPTIAQTRTIGPDTGSTAYTDKFSPIHGGYYGGGSLKLEATHGLWWSSTAYNSAIRYMVYYGSDNNLSTTSSAGARPTGYYIRCVSEEKDVSDLTYMQDMTAKVADSPKGWTLPSDTQIQSIGDGTSTYVSSFSPVLGGAYVNGTLYSESTYGYWWGSTASSGVGRYFLYYNGSSLSTSGNRRTYGVYVRCIQAS
ncbi:hypothetical protein IKF84_03010, partial [Candidatus Saccharibacteria bacterium]|nr:hypothetical protein [Candidatus Saccharibacteria bacterium]